MNEIICLTDLEKADLHGLIIRRQLEHLNSIDNLKLTTDNIQIIQNLKNQIKNYDEIINKLFNL